VGASPETSNDVKRGTFGEKSREEEPEYFEREEENPHQRKNRRSANEEKPMEIGEKKRGSPRASAKAKDTRVLKSSHKTRREKGRAMGAERSKAGRLIRKSVLRQGPGYRRVRSAKSTV